MWQPEPGLQRLAGGSAMSTGGVWRCTEGGRSLVVKRLLAPRREDPPELGDRRHFAYWRRAADVALSGVVDHTPGLRSLPAVKVEEDAAGITLWHPEVRDDRPPPGLFVATAMARFAASLSPDQPWLAVGQLRDRLRRTEYRGGWKTLARTPVADLTDRLWARRGRHLDALDELPRVLQHGDPVSANLPATDDGDVLAIDWSSLGRGPVGGDLGYYALSAREEFEPLLEAYVEALPAGLASHEQAELGAIVTAVYTVVTRAEWALARAADGEGALAGKFRHPSVAPYLRALQRQFPRMEALL